MATDWAKFVHDTAVSAGHPNPDHYVNQIRLESASFDEDIIFCRKWNGIVWGIAQLHPAYYSRDWACDPPRALQMSLSTMLRNIQHYGSETKALIAYNWGPGNMRDKWDGTFAGLPKETQAYLDIIVGRETALKELGEVAVEYFRIGPVIPDAIVRQTDDWSCSVRASFAALWLEAQARGKEAPMYGWWEGRLVPQYVDSKSGLKDGTGAGLASVLRDFGVEANHYVLADIEFVRSHVRAGHPVLIGGHSWGPAGHWALVVGVESDGSLMLANPAGCYPLAGKPICDVLLSSWSKSQWSAVVVEFPRPAEKPDSWKLQVYAKLDELRKIVEDA